MNPSPTKSRSDCSPGGTRPGAERPTRPRVILMILGAGLLMVVMLWFLAHATRPAQPGAESEIAQAEVPPTSNDSEKASVPAPAPPMVDPRGPVASIAPESPNSISDHWGIEITKVGVAAGGKALDLRYKVLDVAKATSMLHLTNYVYIFNQSNSKVLMVPFQRENQTSQKLVAGKTYFTLLPNKEGRVESGSTVTVVLGGSRAENLVVN